MIYEVVEYRKCSGCCGNEECNEDKETLLFEHSDKPPCINFMLKFADTLDFHNEIRIYEKNGIMEDHIDIIGYLLNGRKFTRKLRVQVRE